MRLFRLRRTVLVGVTMLLLGTVVARSAQDPAVALPRPSKADQVEAQTALGPQADGDSQPADGRPGSAPPSPALGASSLAPAPAPGARSTPSGPTEAGAAPDASSAAKAARSSAPGEKPGDSTGEVEQGGTEPSATPGGQAEPVQQAALGTLHAVDVQRSQPALSGRTVRYAVEVEDGIPVSDREFADTVQTVLADARGWQTRDGLTLLPVTTDELSAGAAVDLRITLATPSLTARLCAPLNTTISQVSCWNGHRAVLNLHRWIRGAPTFGQDIAAYRTYLVNHEVGHGLGHRHQLCPAAGQPAPIMVQQTKSLEGCTAWPWPTRP